MKIAHFDSTGTKIVPNFIKMTCSGHISLKMSSGYLKHYAFTTQTHPRHFEKTFFKHHLYLKNPNFGVQKFRKSEGCVECMKNQVTRLNFEAR